MQRLKWMTLGTGLLLASAASAVPPGGPALQPPLPSARIEADLAYLKTALEITPAQVAGWTAVADVLRDTAKHRDARIQAMRAALEKSGTAPIDPIALIEHRQQDLAEESRDLGKLLTAIRPLYASLSDSQKKAAEELVPPLAGPPPGRGPLHAPGGRSPFAPPMPD